MIEVCNLEKTYGDGENRVLAVNHVSFDVKDGEFLSIVGKSGSGKSTLMHMIGGLEKPTSGKIVVDGQDIAGFNSSELTKFRLTKIGFVFQAFHLETQFSVFENIRIPLLISGVDFKEHAPRIESVLEQVDLTEKKNVPISKLSGGQKQRVAIARSLVTGVPYLLADEPCGNLDSESSEMIMKLFRKINQDGKTIVLVTHNIEAAQSTDRIIELKDGRII